jgi:hypothetical protein
MNRRQRLMQAVSDRTNPIVVKELRQAVQSRLVIAILLLFLLANVLVVSGFLLLTIDATTSERGGQDLFDGLFVVLVSTCMVFVPLYAAIRLTMERNDSNIDLLFITTIAPAAIIRGKFWAAVALTALIYSASMPYLTITYLLRGIDLPSIFFALGVAFLCTAIVTMLAIFVGSIAGGLLLRILVFGGLLWLGGCMMAYTLMIGLSVVEMGLASIFSRRDGWGAFGIAVAFGITAWGLFYLLAVAAVSARSSNRMFPVRVFVTACWLIFGVVAGVCTLAYSSEGPVLIWSVASIALLSVILGFTLAERENWTPRVRRYIPRSTPLRFLAWLFYTGSAGGVVWCCALSAATLLGGYQVVGEFTPVVGRSPAKDVFEVMTGVLLFAWCYSMSGLLVRRLIFPKSVPLAGTTLGLALMGVCGTLPLLLSYLIHGPNWRFETLPVIFAVFNPLVLQRPAADRTEALVILSVWGVFGLVVNIPWFLHQWHAFRRHEPKPIPLAPSLVMEPPVIHV